MLTKLSRILTKPRKILTKLGTKKPKRTIAYFNVFDASITSSSCTMVWTGDATYIGIDFKAVTCRPGAAYWEEVPFFDNHNTLKQWPTCGGDNAKLFPPSRAIPPFWFQTAGTGPWTGWTLGGPPPSS